MGGRREGAPKARRSASAANAAMIAARPPFISAAPAPQTCAAFEGGDGYQPCVSRWPHSSNDALCSAPRSTLAMTAGLPGPRRVLQDVDPDSCVS